MQTVQGFASVLARVMIAALFLMAAVGNKIPNFEGVAAYMASAGVPAPQVMLAGAIVFLVAGSVSLIFGFQARIGAALLFVFLAAATYFFHNFWALTGEAQQAQTIQFMKNLSLMGAMLFIIVHGSGKWSLDNLLQRKKIKAT